MGRPILSVSDLSFMRRKDDWAFTLKLDGLDVFPGDQRALIGPSGSGKSTLLDILAMALRPASARRFVLREGADEVVDLNGLWEAEDGDALADLRAHYVGYVLQQGGLLNFLTIRENIALPLRLLGAPVDDTFIQSLTRFLRIDRYLDRRPNELSVGERQRAGIARAVVHRPRLIFADEPTASVDAANAHAVGRLLVDVAEGLGSALIVATHDLDLVNQLGLKPLRLDIANNSGGTLSRFAEE